MIYGGNSQNRYDTFESYNDANYHLVNQSNKDIFHEDLANSETTNEQISDQMVDQSK